MYMWRWAEKKHFIIKKSLFCKTEPLFCCNSAVGVNPPVAVTLPSPRLRLYDDIHLPQTSPNQNTLSPLYNPSSYRKEPINCSDGEHAGKLTPAVQAARSSESQCGWPKSALLFQLFIDRVQPLNEPTFTQKQWVRSIIANKQVHLSLVPSKTCTQQTHTPK